MAGTVQDVMTRTVVAASPEASFKELVRRMHEYRVSSLPVVDAEGKLLGIVSEADLLTKRDPDLMEWHLFEGPHRRRDRQRALGRTAQEVMSSPARTIGPWTALQEAAHVMREGRYKHLPVVDPQGHVLGMVSRVDLLAAFLRSDDAIADEVEALLEERLQEPEVARVEVADGVVCLEGLVEMRTYARRLADRIRVLDGVVSVDAERLEWRVDDTVEPVSSVPWVGF